MPRRRVGEVLDDFVASRATEQTRAAYRSLAGALDDHFAPFSGREDMRSLLGFIRAHERRGLAPTSVRAYLIRLRRLLDYLVEAGVRRDNPVRLDWVPLPRKRSPPRCLTRSEMGRLSKAFDPSTWRGKRDIALFALLAVEGLRCAEVAGLNIESIREG